MYDNEIYGNINRERPDDNSVTGNFSGASSPRNTDSIYGGNNNAGNINSTNTNAVNTNTASGTAYFNYIEAPKEDPSAVSVEAETAAQPESQSVEQPQTVPSDAQEAAQRTIYVARPVDNVAQRTAGGTQSFTGTAQTSGAPHAAADSARNATWEQASGGSGNGKEAPKNAKPQREEKKLGLGQKIMLSISLGLFFGIFAGVGFYGVMQATGALQNNIVESDSGTQQNTNLVDLTPQETIPQLQQAGSNIVYTGAQTNVSAIVKDVMPAMVSIINNYTEVTSFWGQTYRENLSSSGSGIIVAKNDTELLIVTNQHVVSDAEQLLVTLIDNTQVEAKIKGMDADMDLAVIAISLEDLDDETLNNISIATLGDSDNLELGEQVIAIGNALGYGQSVTVGYISALDREIELDDGSIRSFIQTDAAINPGNSGGALLNAAGEVIGINSNKIGGSSIEGMGYAIPITTASPIIADLMERRTRNKVADSDIGYLGIGPQEVTDQISLLYGMPKGVFVSSVQEDSAAEAAGMVKGDIITKFDGSRITCYADLQTTLQYYASGDTVKVIVMRPENGEYVERELTLTLGKRPSSR